jgi:tropomyosin
LEADAAQEQAEQHKGKVKVLEQENLSKEQEITSLSHKNQLLEAEVEKLEASVKH